MSAKKIKVTLADVQSAKQELHKYLEPSPLMKNTWLSEILGCEVYLKMETMLPVGSFKIRGATYRIAKLTPKERKKGVICASAGNHAQGVAWGSRMLKTKATIVMPKNASITKVQNTQALGAEIVLEGDNYSEAFEVAKKIARKTGKVFVHAFEDEDVIAGQGTVALEILDQLEEVDAIFGSIGGGGLMSGVGLVMKELKPSCEVVGVQASGAPSMLLSLKKGKAVSLERVDTFADGIAVRDASEPMRVFLEPLLDRTMEIDDESTANAVLSLIEKAKLVTEGSAAISLAALEESIERNPDRYRGKKVVLIICGGNIDVNILERILDRGLTRAGRRLSVKVVLPDRPGSLAKLTSLIGDGGGNILQAIHERGTSKMLWNETEVDLMIETRGPEHGKAILALLKENDFKFELDP